MSHHVNGDMANQVQRQTYEYVLVYSKVGPIAAMGSGKEYQPRADAQISISHPSTVDTYPACTTSTIITKLAPVVQTA